MKLNTPRQSKFFLITAQFWIKQKNLAIDNLFSTHFDSDSCSM